MMSDSEQGEAGLDMAGSGKTGSVWHGKARHVVVRLDMVWQARHGMTG